MIELQQVQALTKTLTVLYVEDENNAREQLKSILEKFFHRVIVAVDGEDGLNRYKEHKEIDLVITDIQMPRMKGTEMLQAIKALDEEQRALIVSAHNEVSFLTQAIHLGVDGFIIKPVSMEQLLESLYKVAENIHNYQENIRYQTRLETMVRERTHQLETKMVTDELTGLFNRNKMDTLLSDGEKRTVLLADLDNLDHFNAAYGYRFGDKLLLAAAKLFQANQPKGTTLFRINGDQFIYLYDTPAKEQAKKDAAKMISTIQNHPFTIDGMDISLTCTIGIAEGKKEQALIHAHTAVKETRQIGNNRFEVYNNTSHLEEQQRHNLEWAKKVKTALNEDRVIPYFQPIVNNYTGKIEKYECLARLDEGGTIITPDQFIEPARLIGLLPQITRNMIEKCCRYFSERDESFTLNITENDLKEGYLPLFLEKTIKRFKIEPKRLTLEILENISAEGTDEALMQLRRFKEMGFGIALDDFGSETSNFSRLRKLQVDFIKIDGSYIKNLDSDENSFKIVQTIAKFAELIDAKVIAEYVHSEAVEKAVRNLWIDYSQGYYFGEPRREIP